ncbi:uncharacterized protein Z518_01637 [Rhinocladiella mackenziei CBS 650.93]|uniref:Transmembrane protein n=1 Tax=Rhinocladiella mackenziei CBS 650.93 TaxID=1442369 RepID=A0A0D2IX34_9EURO|nr:uncharacterized protein Z518_01637 [Rhinocladiella mackenziei CBS 650.93]KIX10554.1 hypothetical protein Z518_01637 [Rhinocladiella mackenziei CBS 650.93]
MRCFLVNPSSFSTAEEVANEVLIFEKGLQIVALTLSILTILVNWFMPALLPLDFSDTNVRIICVTLDKVGRCLTVLALIQGLQLTRRTRRAWTPPEHQEIGFLRRWVRQTFSDTASTVVHVSDSGRNHQNRSESPPAQGRESPILVDLGLFDDSAADQERYLADLVERERRAREDREELTMRERLLQDLEESIGMFFEH